MVAALICLTLSTVLLGSLLKVTVMHRKQLRFEEYQLQAEWLSESAVARTADRLAEDPDYAGETWKIDAADLDGQHEAQVKIVVQQTADRPDVRTATIVATYPSNATRNTKRTKRVEIQIKSEI